MTLQSGFVDDVFSKTELEYIVKYMATLRPNFVSQSGNSFTGVDSNHPLYKWFVTHVFKKIQSLDIGKPAKLLHGSYLDERTPWNIHSDYYNKKIGEPYLAFIIPISVNNDMEQADKSNTIIFNEVDRFVSPMDGSLRRGRPFLYEGHTHTKKENNATEILSQHLSHIDPVELEHLTVKQILPWKLGRVCYWDEALLHCSDDFVATGNISKQALVIHTYTEGDI